MGRQLSFYCTPSDLVLCMAEAEEVAGLHYYPDSSATPDLAPASTIGAFVRAAIASQEQRFLVLRQGVQVRARKIEPSGMPAWYAFDQVKNPDSVMLHVGRYKGNLVTPGAITTLGNSEESILLFTSIAKRFKKKSKRVQSYWLGPEALLLLRSGARLTPNETASATYDLREK